MIYKSGLESVRAVLLGSAVLLACGASALAQESSGMEEIVVTAERHEQKILSVPASIQADTGEHLNAIGIKNITDLQFITPGYLPADGAGYTQIFIRGIGNSLFVGADPSVATYIDDVPRIYGSMPNQFIDVDRVEVLKGAQGGLYGRNATGGVVNIITRKPTTEAYEGNFEFSYGEHNTISTAGYVNIPVTDMVALSIAAQHNENDPYVKNIASKTPYSAADFSGTSPVWGPPAVQAALLNSGVAGLPGFGSKDQWGTHAKLLLQLNDDLKVTLAGDYFSQSDTSGSQIVNISPAYTQALLSGTLASLGFTPNLPPGFIQASGKFEASIGGPQAVLLHDWGGSATIVWNSPIADITSITAYRGQHTNFFSDLGAATAPLFGALVNNEKHYWYQEVRAVSTTDGPFHWLAGGTFLHDDFTGRTVFNEIGLINAPLVHSYDSVQNWTIYAQAGYDITPELNFTASIRYLEETNNALFVTPDTVTGALINAPPTPPPAPTTASSAQYAAIPSATLSYKLEDGTIYARWARGFKAGGINPVASPGAFIQSGAPLSDGSVFAPEKVDTYEIGWHQSLLDHAMQVTADFFYNDYSNLQVAAHANAEHPAIILAEVNAGSARTYGAEGTVAYHVLPPLTLGASAGYLNAQYVKFEILPNPVLQPFNLDGTTMLNSPKWQLSFVANLDQPIDDRFDLIANVVETHVTKVLFGQSGLPCSGGAQPPACLPDAEGPAYWLTNLRLGIKTSNDKYQLAFYATNLFNEPYYTYGSSSAAAGSLGSWGTPRVVGGEFLAKF